MRDFECVPVLAGPAQDSPDSRLFGWWHFDWTRARQSRKLAALWTRAAQTALSWGNAWSRRWQAHDLRVTSRRSSALRTPLLLWISQPTRFGVSGSTVAKTCLVTACSVKLCRSCAHRAQPGKRQTLSSAATMDAPLIPQSAFFVRRALDRWKGRRLSLEMQAVAEVPQARTAMIGIWSPRPPIVERPRVTRGRLLGAEDGSLRLDSSGRASTPP